MNEPTHTTHTNFLVLLLVENKLRMSSVLFMRRVCVCVYVCVCVCVAVCVRAYVHACVSVCLGGFGGVGLNNLIFERVITLNVLINYVLIH